MKPGFQIGRMMISGNIILGLIWTVRPRLVGSRSATPMIGTRIRIAALAFALKQETYASMQQKPS